MNQKNYQILEILKKTYPDAKIALNFSTPIELLVAVILSAQCTDKMVNRVTENLFTKYRTLEDYVNADVIDFEQNIKSTGFYHNKAKNIINALRIIHTKFQGSVPATMEEILTLPGVARKTANIVLGNAYGVVSGIAVDTHVHRISQRLRLIDLNLIGGKKKIFFIRNSKQVLDYIKDAIPDKIEKLLMDSIPRQQWMKINYMIVDHGRNLCKAKNPDCFVCPLNVICESSRN